jgi:hypothetical protein
MDEFYPVEAKHSLKEDSLDHSILKWTGLKAENLKEHQLHTTPLGIADDKGRELGIDAGTCALCFHYRDYPSCEECPLAISRAGHPCDYTMGSEEYSPFTYWIREDNPMPMLENLVACKEGL